MRNTLRHAAAALVMLLGLAAGDVAAQSAPEPAPKPMDLPAAVEHLMTKLLRARSGLRVGMSSEDAFKEFASAARIVTTHFLSLEKTHFGPPGWKGTVSSYHFTENKKLLDELHVVLLCDKFDRKALTRHVLAVGKKLGRTLKFDEEDGVIWESEPTGSTEVSVSLAGDGVIYFEISLND